LKQDIASRTLRIGRCPNENLKAKEKLLIIVCQLIRGRNGFTSQKASQMALASFKRWSFLNYHNKAMPLYMQVSKGLDLEYIDVFCMFI
jgi:hypothetical protein